jgi:hypothetical protein
MLLNRLVDQLHQKLPNATDRSVACLAMLICDRDPELLCLSDKQSFGCLLEESQLKMQSLDDQHAAVSNELGELASTEPCEFQPKHVWTLIRAIKVQSQFVDLLTGARVS